MRWVLEPIPSHVVHSLEPAVFLEVLPCDAAVNENAATDLSAQDKVVEEVGLLLSQPINNNELMMMNVKLRMSKTLLE